MATAALTGSLIGGVTETALVTGGRTVVITLTGDTWIPSQDTDYGPQASIGASAPPGAVTINPGDNIQAAVNAWGEGTTFWLRTGTHNLTSSIVPKTGNTFIGEFGAELDGAGWTNPSAIDAAFQAVNVNVDNVTISNLVIRNMLQKGIYVSHTTHSSLSGWVIDHCEIDTCGFGVVPGNAFVIQHCHIVRCRTGAPVLGGAYAGTGHGLANTLDDVLFFHNWIEDCGHESHLVDCQNIVFRDNLFQNMDTSAIWTDGIGYGFIAEGNRVEGGVFGVHYEFSMEADIHDNVFVGVESAIYISTSRNCHVHLNTITDCFRGITLFVNYPSLGTFPWDADLEDNTIEYNTFNVNATPGTFAIIGSFGGTGDDAHYRMPTNAANNLIDHNTYHEADPVNVWAFLWAFQTAGGDGTRNFASWQALTFDLNGTSD